MPKAKPFWLSSALRGLAVLGLLVSPTSGLPSSLAAAELAAPNALVRPENVACRAHGGNPNTLRVSWQDTNDNAADYKVYRQEVGSNTWSEIGSVTDPDSDGNWLLVDANANAATYRYSVTAFSGNEETVKGEAN
ncbi:MAG TPA: fibronectin type III domain-containing protein, partial [Caldilineaceae bacterium]|nr:fibronectin type III domain-containing protein [Caldilineaceae bacterium]